MTYSINQFKSIATTTYFEHPSAEILELMSNAPEVRSEGLTAVGLGHLKLVGKSIRGQREPFTSFPTYSGLHNTVAGQLKRLYEPATFAPLDFGVFLIDVASRLDQWEAEGGSIFAPGLDENHAMVSLRQLSIHEAMLKV